MLFYDTVKVNGDKLKKREDGSMLADALVARTGIQEYLGLEMGKPEMDIVRVYRPADEVFSTDAMVSFAYRPVTDDHPSQLVNASNWKDLAVGTTSGDVGKQDGFLRVPLMISDQAMIKQIESGKVELSAGYTCDIEWTSGVDDAGNAYDAIQRNIRANHVAVVDRGRAGKECRIGDDEAQSKGASPLNQRKEKRMSKDTQQVVVDGKVLEVDAQTAVVIDGLQKANTEAQATIAAKDKEIGEKDAKIKELEDKQMSDEELDKLIDERAQSKQKRDAVTKVHGEDAVKEMSDDQIDALFSVLSDAQKKADPVGDSLRSKTNDGAGADDGDLWGDSVFDAAGVTKAK